MPYIKRDLEGKILSLSSEYACILMTGPRQVGKTTVMRHLAGDDRTYVTLDDLEEYPMLMATQCVAILKYGANDTYIKIAAVIPYQNQQLF